MDHYEKVESNTVEEANFVIPGTATDGVVHMKVNPGSKIRNLVEYAKRRAKESDTKQVTWSASGKGTAKAISCAEIFKRLMEPKFKLHQVTKIRFKRIEEVWKPKIEGLDTLKVNVDVPAISILLSKEPLDESEPGYQPPGPFDLYWRGKNEDENKNEKRKPNAKHREKTDVGKPEVRFEPKRQKGHYDTNSKRTSGSGASSGGKKENKQKKNEKRRASEESVKSNGKAKNNVKNLKESDGQSSKQSSNGQEPMES